MVTVNSPTWRSHHQNTLKSYLWTTSDTEGSGSGSILFIRYFVAYFLCLVVCTSVSLLKFQSFYRLMSWLCDSWHIGSSFTGQYLNIPLKIFSWVSINDRDTYIQPSSFVEAIHKHTNTVHCVLMHCLICSINRPFVFLQLCLRLWSIAGPDKTTFHCVHCDTKYVTGDTLGLATRGLSKCNFYWAFVIFILIKNILWWLSLSFYHPALLDTIFMNALHCIVLSITWNRN